MVCSGVDMPVAFPEIADTVFADAFGRVFTGKIVSVRGIDVAAAAGQGKEFQGFLFGICFHRGLGFIVENTVIGITDIGKGFPFLPMSILNFLFHRCLRDVLVSLAAPIRRRIAAVLPVVDNLLP